MNMFGKLIFDGSVAYVTTHRLFRDDKVPGFYYYGLRSELSEDNELVYSVEPFVFVNFIGTLVTESEIKFDDPADEYRVLTDDEIGEIECALYDGDEYSWNELMNMKADDEEDRV